MKTDIQRAANTLLTINESLPTLSSVASAGAITKVANERGYLKPDEDDAIRELFSGYLRCRSALLQTIQDLRPLANQELRKKQPDHPEIFIVSYAASVLLLRAAHVLIDTFKGSSIATTKLNEAEPRFGIRRKQFTKIYRSATSAKNLWAFIQAREYWGEHRSEFIKQMGSQDVMTAIIKLIDRDEPFIDTGKRNYAKRRLRYRLHAFLRRHQSGLKQTTFALFEASGRLISELKIGWIPRRKRITPKVRAKLSDLLEAGDLLITRHDDAVTNLFLPGFWPHAALYIGTDEQRLRLGLANLDLTDALNQAANKNDPICTLEALKDGVHRRRLSNTLAVDACVILRPKLTPEKIRDAIERGLSHEGKEYDFEFDFRRSDKLVCTEVIYRAYHQIGHIDFELTTRAGRVCLSAEDLLDCSLDNVDIASGLKNPFFEVVAIFGYRGNRLAKGEDAKTLMQESYRRPQ